MRLGGIILCGGLSSRFGSPKALQAFGAETMLERVVRQLATVATPIMVVAARDQLLPALPSEVTVLRDRQPVSGPLEGLRAGLAALEGHCEIAYLTGCDYPLLVPAFAHRLCELLGEHDVSIPEVKGILQPLAAVYRVSLLSLVEQILATSSAGPRALVDRASTRVVTSDELRLVDPHLDSLLDVDEPQDYEVALQRAGLTDRATTSMPE